jgi:hypothetical protein
VGYCDNGKGITCRDAPPQEISFGSFIETAAALARSGGGRSIFSGSSSSWSCPATSEAAIRPGRPEAARIGQQRSALHAGASTAQRWRGGGGGADAAGRRAGGERE